MVDLNDVLLQELSELSEEDQVAFLSTLSKKDQEALTSSLDQALTKQSTGEGLFGMLPEGTQAATEEEFAALNEVLGPLAGVVGGGALGAAAGAGAGAAGLGALATGAVEGGLGSLSGELISNITRGRDTSTGEGALATGIGAVTGVAGQAAIKGVSKALANETVREGINKIVSTAGNTLKSVGQNVDDAAERVFSGIIKSRESTLNAINKRNTALLNKLDRVKALDKDVDDIVNVVNRIEVSLGGPQRGLAEVRNILSKDRVTQRDLIRISDSLDRTAFESTGILPDELKKSNITNIVAGKLPQEHKDISRAYEQAFKDFGDAQDPNFKSFLNVVKQKTQGLAVPTEVLADTLTNTAASKQAGAKLIGELADKNIIDVNDIETVFLGDAARSAKKIPDIISEGDPELIRQITSGQFNPAQSLNELAESGQFVSRSGQVDPNNLIPDPTKVFNKFNDSKFTGALKSALGKKGSESFTRLNRAAKDVNKSKILSDEIRKFSNEAALAGQESSILDASLQGLGAAQDVGTLTNRLNVFQGVANPATAAAANQLIQGAPSLFNLGPRR